jgi:hypothetical protein
MACQAESERYLNVVPVVHGGGVANIVSIHGVSGTGVN